MDEPLTYVYEPEPCDSFFKEGATQGWLVMHSGLGPGRAMPVVALTVGDVGTIESAGEWQDVTITDD